MWINWECASCHEKSMIEVNLESKTGKVIRCMKCRQKNEINWQVEVKATAHTVHDKPELIEAVAEHSA